MRGLTSVEHVTIDDRAFYSFDTTEPRIIQGFSKQIAQCNIAIFIGHNFFCSSAMLDRVSGSLVAHDDTPQAVPRGSLNPVNLAAFQK